MDNFRKIDCKCFYLDDGVCTFGNKRIKADCYNCELQDEDDEV